MHPLWCGISVSRRELIGRNLKISAFCLVHPRFLGHKDSINDVEFTQNGNLIGSASSDRTVRLWIPSVKGESTVFKAHIAAVRSLNFSATSDQMITASDDKTVKIWAVNRQQFQISLIGHNNWVRSAKFSPDARMAISGYFVFSVQFPISSFRWRR